MVGCGARTLRLLRSLCLVVLGRHWGVLTSSSAAGVVCNIEALLASWEKLPKWFLNAPVERTLNCSERRIERQVAANLRCWEEGTTSVLFVVMEEGLVRTMVNSLETFLPTNLRYLGIHQHFHISTLLHQVVTYVPTSVMCT